MHLQIIKTIIAVFFLYILSFSVISQSSNDTIYSNSEIVLLTTDHDSLFLLTEFHENGSTKSQGRVFVDKSKYDSIEAVIYSWNFPLNIDALIKTGNWEHHYSFGGARRTIYSHYKNGERNGSSYTVVNKDTIEINNYINNELHGLCFKFSKDSTKKLYIDSLTYKGGVLNGYYTRHYGFGQIHERGFYKNGLKHGNWLHWDPFGQKTSILYDKDREKSNEQVKLSVSKRVLDYGPKATSFNGSYSLVRNGSKDALYDLKRKRIVNSSISINYVNPSMGDKINRLSNDGDFFIQYYIDAFRNAAISITDLRAEEDIQFKGIFYDLGKGNRLLYENKGYIRDYKLRESAYDSLKIDCQTAGYSTASDRIYIVKASKIYIYSALIKPPIDSIDFPLSNGEYYSDYYLRDDQLIAVGDTSVDYNSKLKSLDIIWVDLLSKEIKKLPPVEAEFNSHGYWSIDPLFLTNASKEYLIFSNCCDYETKRKLVLYDGNKDWSELDISIENARDIRLNENNQIVYWDKEKHDYRYYNLENGTSDSYQGLPITSKISEAGFENGIFSFKTENESKYSLNLASLNYESFNSIPQNIDSNYLGYYNNLRRLEETLYFLEDTESKNPQSLINGYRSNLFHLDKNHMISRTSYNYRENVLSFENYEKENRLKQLVYFVSDTTGKFAFFTPDNYYATFNQKYDLITFDVNNQSYPLEQFDLKYNRPDIILDRLGYADSSLIAAYHAAYKKRLKKMGFTEDMLEDDFHLPEIEIENFEKMPTILDKDNIDLNLHLEDSKYNLDRINVWVNDVAIYGTDGISLRDQDAQKFDKTVNVELAKGQNKVQVSVLNQAGAESYKETFEVKCSVGKKKPDLYLITIGESEFQQNDFNLTYAAKDAKDIASLFPKSKVYNEVFTKTLTNDQVTRENVVGLQSFLEKADINDHVMVFLAGHGVLSADLDYYLATYDMDFTAPEKRGLMYEDLEGLLDGIKPLKKTLILDACHSGEIDKEEVELASAENTFKGNVQFRSVGKSVKSKLGAQNTLELTKSLFTDLRKGTGATVISSAGGMEFAMEGDDWNNGLFTYALLNGIESGEADLNGDKEIWLSELKEYVGLKVMELSNGKQQPTSRIENQTVDFRVW